MVIITANNFFSQFCFIYFFWLLLTVKFLENYDFNKTDANANVDVDVKEEKCDASNNASASGLSVAESNQSICIN